MFAAGDIVTGREAEYHQKLERLWDMLSDAIEGGRLTEADIPDDYQALVEQMAECEAARDAAENDPELQ